MALLHHLRFVLVCAAVLASGGLVIHAISQPAVPGQTLTWAQPQASPATPPAASAAASRSLTPAASLPAATADPGPLGALRGPLGSLFQHLNSDTARNAAGQYSILQEIENALRDHIDQFLNWIVGRR